jgi:hypothetical protein
MLFSLSWRWTSQTAGTAAHGVSGLLQPHYPGFLIVNANDFFWKLGQRNDLEMF